MKIKSLLLAASAATLCFAPFSVQAAPAASNTNAQGIMVSLTTSGDFAIVQTNIYKFNVATAETYFTNTLTSGPIVTCTGGGAHNADCAASNQPATPAAPAPDQSAVDGHPEASACKNQECTFLNGGTLQGSTSTQSVNNVSGLNGHGNWSFKWTYTIAPTGDGSVAPFTAWDLVSSEGDGTATVNIDALIAGESLVVNKTFPCKSGTAGTPACGKFSFSLGSNDNPRVSGLEVQVKDGGGNVVAGPFFPSPTINQGAAFGSLTFPYTTNAGSNGPASYLQDGDAYTVMQSNDVPGGGFGPSDLQDATIDTLPVNLGPGSYSVEFTGTVKDNSGAYSTPFDITQSVNIVTPGCGNGPHHAPKRHKLQASR